jgi:hypothetical protein
METAKAIKEELVNTILKDPSVLKASGKRGNQVLDFRAVDANVQALAASMIWLEELIKLRMEELEHGNKLKIEEYAEKTDKSFLLENTSLHKLLSEYNGTYIEYLLISLTFTAWFRPRSLKGFGRKKPESDEMYSETGIFVNKTNNRYIPTLQTLIFMLAGTDMVKQAYYHSILLSHVLFKDQVLHLRKPFANDNFPLDYMVELDLAYYNYLIHGKKPRFDHTPDFPANLLETEKLFSDLVLKPATRDQLQIILDYARVNQTLFEREGVRQKIKPGMLAMLYGPPGTGKTLTASLLGKEAGVDVYRIDLSRVISKYIGETEKNLERVFERLGDKNCILFFDEADVLFGKRTEVSDAKDRYANQEVAYLLQRVETFPGLVLLASNFKQNLDTAFKRRILVSVYMPPPDADERLVLWESGLPGHFIFEPATLAEDLAIKHAFTGANIANIIKLACITAESNNTNIITSASLAPFIASEYAKEGQQNRRTNS